MCVLGAIIEHYEALYNVHMYVCMCLKECVNYGHPLRFVVFFHKTKCVNIFLKILNLEGQQNSIIGSKNTTIFLMFFFSPKKSKTSNLWEGIFVTKITNNFDLSSQK